MLTRFLQRPLILGTLALTAVALSACSIQETGSISPSLPTPEQRSPNESADFIPPAQDIAALSEKLRAAVAEQDAQEVQRLVSAGADVDTKDAEGRPALVLATRSNAVDVAKALILAGANVNAQDTQQDSAFLFAGAEGLDEILKLTLAHGADVASTNRYGGTALIPAAEHGYVQTIKLLLETEIDVNHVNNLGWTALLEAVILGSGGTDHQEVIKLLIEAGADVNLPDAQGVSALEHARQKQQSAVAKLLEEAGARR
ncbi:hypothetical protein CQ018_12640 [Arthrobacter sp. MYb227]|uniref:ankyrin repeat domain-containing protein n=1 Tax=Arthrobacter sp. MYb227 TaxID=1848601 RepID=UPI000CFBBD04|nr:ankyrin repeat domain-containing protein [Arthrobacter sp. MYb227]PQZ92341.1 hypothetical protein CQ018_12640 [Arthrobacter sp. MYb227]